VSFRIDAGQLVAIVGPSGAGKSTIFRLLLGFEQAAEGSVCYDDKRIEMLDLTALRRQIGTVLQNGKLNSGTIYENICAGTDLPLDQVWHAAELAGLADDIHAMPLGMHTIIPEGFSTLSGGQRQRLMIARSLAHRPRILLFDEATSALDNKTQAHIINSISKLNLTRVVIAHRISTVQNADRIIVLVRGEVAQQGTFADLCRSPGPFSKLIRRQIF
jgi:ATP-binding cassette subfamily C protein